MTFGQRIRQLRLEKRLSQRDLAKCVGVDFTYLSKIENGKVAPPSDDVIHKLAEELEASEEELLALAGKVSQTDLREVIAGDVRIGFLFRKLQSGEMTESQIKQILNIMKTGEGEDAPGNSQ